MVEITKKLDSESILKIEDQSVWRLIDNKVILFVPETGESHSFDEVATFIWTQLEQSIKMSDLIERICREYEADVKIITADTYGFIEKLASIGVITVDAS